MDEEHGVLIVCCSKPLIAGITVSNILGVNYGWGKLPVVLSTTFHGFQKWHQVYTENSSSRLSLLGSQAGVVQAFSIGTLDILPNVMSNMK